MYQLTVIVPLFNEEENLLRVEQKLGEYAENSSIPTQILLVNDGSTDNSLEMVRRSVKDLNILVTYLLRKMLV